MSYSGVIAHSEQSAPSSGTPITDADGAYFVVAATFRTGAEKYAGPNGVQAVSKMAQLSLDPENRFIRYDYRANRSVREAMTHALRFFAAGLVLCMGTAGQADTVSERLDRLVRAYPRALAGHDERYLYWRDGTRMSVGEPEERKSFDDLLRRASILDQLSLSYPQGDAKPSAVNADPGRFRNEAFFKKMYGDCSRGEVSANLVSIVWLPSTWGETIRVTRVNGVADRLKQVSEEIDALDPAIKRAAYPIAGVLSCRPVADTGAMSMHGYAAAIDLNLSYSDYWLWKAKSKTILYQNRMPRQIVEIFERNGFIWGGKWYHYDTMHFEYRPELLHNKRSGE